MKHGYQHEAENIWKKIGECETQEEHYRVSCEHYNTIHGNRSQHWVQLIRQSSSGEYETEEQEREM